MNGRKPIALALLVIPFNAHDVTFVARLLVLGLAALWLPLTMHCQLAAMIGCGERASCCEHHCGCDDGCDCHSDACKTIESGNYLINRDFVPIMAASCVPCGWMQPVACLRPATPAASLNAATGAPPGWIRIWQFALRAAPAPRAPSATA